MSDLEDLEEKKKRLELERSIKILETQKKVTGMFPRVVKIASILAVIWIIAIIIDDVF